MQLTFLEASVPLTKQYEKRPDGSYVGGAYPGAYKFTSHEQEVNGLDEFAAALSEHAKSGHCLLTDGLERPIVDEPRAKLSKQEPTRKWVVLDVDGLDYQNPDQFIHDVLPVPFHKVGYVVQYSPSQLIKPGLRAHLYFLLDGEADVKLVSGWLKYMNLATEKLKDQITLSKSKMALTLRLDWVANNNGRIIYITPPECVGFDDPVTQRISVVKKDHEYLNFNFASVSHEKITKDYRDMVDQLRADAGLEKKRNKEYYEYKHGVERLKKELTPTMRITGFEPDSAMFMRCNLDGGDSWAYFYHRNRAQWLHNFKGEPALHLPSLDPEFYKKVAEPDMKALQEKEEQPFVFVDKHKDRYMVGARIGEEITEQPFPMGSERKVEHWFGTYGQTPPDPFPVLRREFRPDLEGQWFPDEKLFNSWCPTEYMSEATYRSLPPLTINKIIEHVTGNDVEAYHHFMNWLAFIYQKRTKTGTAWVLHGCPGTGKGLLVNYVLRPIFGNNQVVNVQVRDLKAKFNGFMEEALFVNVDETNTEDAGGEESAVIEALKLWITEPVIKVEHKGKDQRFIRNFSNFVFTSNDYGQLPIQDGDRRYNVAPRQDAPIVFGAKDMAQLNDELLHFAGYLSGYEVDEDKAHTPLENEAKEELRDAAMDSVEVFVSALHHGDLQFFIDYMDAALLKTSDSLIRQEFRDIVARWMGQAKKGGEHVVTLKDAHTAYVAYSGQEKQTQGRFKVMMKKRGFGSKRIRVGGRRDSARPWGWKVEWQLDDDLKRDLGMHLKAVEKSSEDLEEKIKAETGKVEAP